MATAAKKSAAKKTAGKKAPASQKAAPTKTAAKRTSARKSTAKKTPAKRSATKANAKKTAARKYSPRASEDVREEMEAMKHGELKIGRSGKPVTNPKQAIAIGLAKARREGAKVPPNPHTGR